MDLQMRNCRQCKRLIASDATRDLCDVCFDQYDMELGYIKDAIEVHKLTTPETIAEYTHISLEGAQKILDEEQLLTGGPKATGLCSHCGKKPTMEDSPYCLGCQLGMYKSLGDSANKTAGKPFMPDPKDIPPAESARNALSEKRERAGFKRLNPSTKSVKGTGGN